MEEVAEMAKGVAQIPTASLNLKKIITPKKI